MKQKECQESYEEAFCPTVEKVGVVIVGRLSLARVLLVVALLGFVIFASTTRGRRSTRSHIRTHLVLL